MAYPFLPVNPCCTNITINNPSACEDDHVCIILPIESSNIIYNGASLSCITANPCDTLNVVLQKIDEVICNLLLQVNSLTNELANITSQVIFINGEIIDIYNTIADCSYVTTTTTLPL